MLKKINLILIIAAIVQLSGCAYLQLEPPDETAETTEVVTPVTEPVVENKITPLKKEVTKEHADFPNSVPADKALGWLKNGNTRYLKHNLRKDGQSAQDIARLSANQQPHSIILSCSDSRVPPELLFDQKLGEIFVVRTAGHTADSSAIASIEYALEHLGVKNIVVMGHTNCGAVKTALACMDGQDAGSADLNNLVQHIHPHFKNADPKSPSPFYTNEAWEHVQGVMHELSKKSEIIADRINRGGVKVNGALYSLQTGKVEFKN